jgi:hypothetical protein
MTSHLPTRCWTPLHTRPSWAERLCAETSA